jgi:hypothetical protein
MWALFLEDSMVTKYFFAAIVGALSLSAHASDTSWGPHGALEVGVNLASPGDFSDNFIFTLAQGAVVVSSAVSNNLGGVLQIDNGFVKLYKETGVEDTLLASYSFDGTTGSTFHNFAVTAPGTYYYNVVGEATGTAGGFYSLTSTAAPVPEPASWALALGGICAAGALYRRRQQA